MSDERAILWIGVTGLMAVGFMVGQAAAITIAAMVALYLLYDRTDHDAA